MKKFIFVFILFCLAAFPIFGQKRKTIVKSAPRKQTPAPVTEIPAKDWDAITDALNREDWTQAALVSRIALGKLKSENNQKQLARLRYFYIYALAGKVAEGKTAYAELEKAANNFIGKEFMTPNRTILADCAGRVNYICAVKGDDQTLRVTATDKVATIHLFEYVKLTEKFDVVNNNNQTASPDGILEKVESHLTKSNVRIMRLIFGQGFVQIVHGL
ncbi:MAG: hypothetical protein ACR2GD_04050 [Pyrinomonadaceae bacterium]